MGTDLLSIFKKADLKEVGKTTGNIISLGDRQDFRNLVNSF